MIKLTIGSSEIPINPGISFPLVMKSPLFVTSEGKIPGSYIFNTSIPATQALRTEFGHAHRIMRNGRATAELNYILEDGTFRFAGKCSVTEANERKYEIAFRVNNGDLAGILSIKSLKDLNLGGDRAITGVCSFASMTNSITFLQTDETYFEIDVNAPDQIISDFFNRMTDSGRTFTADGTFTCTLFITIAGSFNVGSLHLTVTKNGSTIIDEIINSSSTTGHFEQNLSLVNGDVIIVDAVIETEITPEGYSCDIFLEEFIIEYSKENIFTSTAILDQNDSDFAVFPIQNEALLTNFPDDAFELDNLSIKTIYSKYQKVHNYWIDGEFRLFPNGLVEGESIACANLFTPMVYMRKLVEQIAEEAGYRIVNNPFDDANFTNCVLFNSYAENTYSSDETKLIPIKQTFNLTDHVPDVKQSDFMRHISLFTGTVPIVDNNQLTITFVKVKNIHIESPTNESLAFPGKILELPLITVDPEYKGITFDIKAAGQDQYLSDRVKEISEKLNYKGTVPGISSLPSSGNSINDYYKVISDNSFYVYQYNPDIYQLGWWFLSKDFPLNYSEGEEPFLKYEIDLCPVITSLMQDETLLAPANRFWNIPVTSQAGTMEGFPESLSAVPGYQVLRYMGLHDDSLGNSYPLGTSWMVNYDGTALTGIDFNAEALFNSLYKDFLQWIAYSTKPVKCKAILTAAQLKKLDFAKIYRYEGYSFLIKEVRVNLLYDRLSVAEMDIYIC